MSKRRPARGRRAAPKRAPLPPRAVVDPNEALLMIVLEAAVPRWIDRHRGLPIEQRAARAKELAHVVSSRGDQILFRGTVKGTTAEAFNALAEGIALLAFAPGGVTFAGRHWQAPPAGD